MKIHVFRHLERKQDMKINFALFIMFAELYEILHAFHLHISIRNIHLIITTFQNDLCQGHYHKISQDSLTNSYIECENEVI